MTAESACESRFMGISPCNSLGRLPPDKQRRFTQRSGQRQRLEAVVSASRWPPKRVFDGDVPPAHRPCWMATFIIPLVKKMQTAKLGSVSGKNCCPE